MLANRLTETCFSDKKKSIFLIGTKYYKKLIRKYYKKGFNTIENDERN